MRQKLNPYMVIGLVALLCLVAWFGLFSNWRPPIRWNRTFTNSDAQPFGMSLTYERLADLFPNVPVSVQEEEIYFLQEDTTYSDQLLIIVNDRVPIDSFDVDELLYFVEIGNQAFIASSSMPDELMEVLGMKDYGRDSDNSLDSLLLKRSQGPSVYVSFPKKDLNFPFFDPLPTEAQALLWTQQDDPAYVYIPYGQGAFWLHKYPRLLTNYYLLDSIRSGFIDQSFGVIPPPAGILWDEYYKANNLRRVNRRRNSDSSNDRPYSLKAYLADKPALAWGIGLLLVSLLLYALFESKRTRRLVPVYEPPPNTTLEFAETIGRLYYQNADHKNLAEKMIRSWREYLRIRFFMDTMELGLALEGDPEWIGVLTAKSGMSELEIKRLLRLVKRVQDSTQISDETLIQIHDELAIFYANAGS